MELTKWKFTTENLEKSNDLLFEKTKGEDVTVPHTWSIDDKYQMYRGIAFYSTEVNIQEIAEYNILRFEAVYRDAIVYINGKKAFSHKNSGYTPFEFDVTDYLIAGNNVITVFCDNSFSKDALPYDNQFDWACDGGIIRNVYFNQKCNTDIKDIRVSPCNMTFDGDKGTSYLSVDVMLFGKVENQNITFEIVKKDGNEVVSFNEVTDNNGEIHIIKNLGEVVLWSTENPYLYTAKIKCENDEKNVRFGVRLLTTIGNKIVFNGEEITLRGLEWMPGSNPDYGIAEPKSIAFSFIKRLKDIGCNFTRFHWQQPDFIYDWCDENGLMVQEEIPYWGHPKTATSVQYDVAKMQEEEMYAAHKNHASIVCWGVGNELGGGEPETIRYVYEAINNFKRIDNTRLVNFVSNTLHRVDNLDATMFGDICMWNEYLGLWYPELTDVDLWVGKVKEMCKGKPFMITEAGLCEPAFDGGDKRRCDIYNERERIYRKHQLNGWVYFSLNDYRTHMGEYSDGKMCARIHGSTDIYGNEKPSLKLLSKLLHEKV